MLKVRPYSIPTLSSIGCSRTSIQSSELSQRLEPQPIVSYLHTNLDKPLQLQGYTCHYRYPNLGSDVVRIVRGREDLFPPDFMQWIQIQYVLALA